MFIDEIALLITFLSELRGMPTFRAIQMKTNGRAVAINIWPLCGFSYQPSAGRTDNLFLDC